jgi:hypothetical protein
MAVVNGVLMSKQAAQEALARRAKARQEKIKRIPIYKAMLRQIKLNETREREMKITEARRANAQAIDSYKKTNKHPNIIEQERARIVADLEFLKSQPAGHYPRNIRAIPLLNRTFPSSPFPSNRSDVSSSIITTSSRVAPSTAVPSTQAASIASLEGHQSTSGEAIQVNDPQGQGNAAARQKALLEETMARLGIK